MSEAACHVCGDTFSTEKGLRDHSWDVHSVCYLCDDEFEDRDGLYIHWLEIHGDELSREARKRAEKKVGDRTVCPVCSERFASDQAVSDHAWNSHKACHYCGEQFDTAEDLYTHWLALHEVTLTRSDHKQATAAVGPLTFSDRLAHQGPGGAISGVRLSRRALIGGGTIGVAALLGGLSLGGVFGPSDGGHESNRVLVAHPAATALDSQPVLGPQPSEAEGTIIAFEDPSCPSCARFELGTFPQLKSELIDTGRVAFAFRGIPVVQPWGEPAVLALESTYARDETAFWALKSFYYDALNQLDSGNVRSETRRFLDGQTDVDAAAVLGDVDAGTHRDSVQTDLKASNEAGVGGTPTFFLFNEREFVTEIVGPQPYTVFKNSLGV